MQEEALGPLDLVKLSALNESLKEPSIDIPALATTLEDVAQKAAAYINDDVHQEFLYKNPNGWKRQASRLQEDDSKTSVVKHTVDLYGHLKDDSFVTPSTSTASQAPRTLLEPWSLLGDFDFRAVVPQIIEFIESWQLTPATRFVVIAQEKCDCIEPFGQRYYVEAHFSKPTPKCPNPLAVAKVYFQVNVCHLLPRDYPVNVTYKFEGYRSMFYAMGARKMSSCVFQPYLIDSILHMKLAFYAELCECRNPRKRLEKDGQEKNDREDNSCSK